MKTGLSVGGGLIFGMLLGIAMGNTGLGIIFGVLFAAAAAARRRRST